MLAPYSAAVPFLPLLYVAWADGELTRAEIESTQAKLAGQSWPEKGAHEALLSWLRPEAPPTPNQLRSLLRTIRALGSDLPPEQRRSRLHEPCTKTRGIRTVNLGKPRPREEFNLLANLMGSEL